jgi:hypothetical protein
MAREFAIGREAGHRKLENLNWRIRRLLRRDESVQGKIGGP